MNHYLKNLNRIEVIVTMACTGKCIHCSQGDHKHHSFYLNEERVLKTVNDVCSVYNIESLMVFGGEPLMFSFISSNILAEAYKLKIPRRQIITNGYFSKTDDRTEETVKLLKDCNVNDLLLSADAFHQETIPLEPVLKFAGLLVKENIPVRMNPAWLVSRDDNNTYNMRTKEILSEFEKIGIPVGEGNIVFPRGNAAKYLKEYFKDNVNYICPYDENPEDIRTITIDSSGYVFGKSIDSSDIIEILEDYNPSYFKN